MNDLTTFTNPQFGNLRTVIRNDELWFVAKDVASALGYKQTAKAVRDELSITKELLGFKYWIIKRDQTLSQVFAADIIWNKTA